MNPKDSVGSINHAPQTVPGGTNPKDAVGSLKAMTSGMPDSAILLANTAFFEGRTKYGSYNWRATQVQADIYVDAARRHLMLWWNGQNTDPTTGIDHRASVIACMAILIDAECCGNLIDNRPLPLGLDYLMDKIAKEVQPHIREVFKDKDPKHWTIQDACCIAVRP